MIKMMWGRNEDDRRKCKNQANIKFFSFQNAQAAKEANAEKLLLGRPMWIKWDKALCKQYESLGLLSDYRGINDPDLQLQYIENQLLMHLTHQKKNQEHVV